ncbi:hypothetical protein GEMRC1_000602 [Eukaryota sp. GEM-RC1]
MTNDTYFILHLLNRVPPAVRTKIELTLTQDEEVGDGTSSVMILASEPLAYAEPLFNFDIHPQMKIILKIQQSFFRSSIEFITAQKFLIISN